MKRFSIIALSVVAAILLGVFLLPIVAGKLDEWRYRPTSNFRSAEWKKPDMKYRYAVLSHVANNVVKRGMTEAEVEGLLGNPTTLTDKTHWQYETRRPSYRFIDFSGGGLLVKFDANRLVTEVQINTWVD